MKKTIIKSAALTLVSIVLTCAPYVVAVPTLVMCVIYGVLTINK